jgi:K+-transporting ATPase ATPase C chain
MMETSSKKTGLGRQAAVAGLWVGLSMALCGGLYSGLIWLAGRGLAPDKAEGSLLFDAAGNTVGSRLISQEFVRPEYVWPRPSAAGHDASRSGPSNLGPSSPALRKRVEETVRRFGASPDRPLPPDLAFASGSGLDPNLSLEAALYQAGRIAGARGISEEFVRGILIRMSGPAAGTLGGMRLVNVLLANLELDRAAPLLNGPAGEGR